METTREFQPVADETVRGKATQPMPHTSTTRLRIAPATDADRDAIYRLRHDVYARELGQHAENADGRLSDALDAFNVYIAAFDGDELAGFVSITPPGHGRYSIDKYVARNELPFPCNDRLYEVRLLTVAAPHRGRPIAGLLMYAAVRWIIARGGERIVAIGRREVLDLYRKVGLELLGRSIQSGAVTFELMTGSASTIARDGLARYTRALRRLEDSIDWQLGLPLYPDVSDVEPATRASRSARVSAPAVFLTASLPDGSVRDRPQREPQRESSHSATCYHGGASWDAIGDEFDALDRAADIVPADVLDAWFPPAPGVLAALREHLPFLLKTSPPTGCEGLIRAIARVRGVHPASVLPGAGSSALIFQAFQRWLTPQSRVLILDPTYGEYPHVLERVIGCRVDRLPLARDDGYRFDPARLKSQFDAAYDLIVLVNPNSPTGRHVARTELEAVLRRVPNRTRVWIDETYIEYAGPDQSLERFASESANVVVCKSMSKVYALSGVRVAYLCSPAALTDSLRTTAPPWSVSLPAQVAAVAALSDPVYYAARYAETHALRAELIAMLRSRIAPSSSPSAPSLEIIPSVANFVLCHLPPHGPDAATVCSRCRAAGIFVRDASTMSPRLGTHALRIAVRDGDANRRVVIALIQALE